MFLTAGLLGCYYSFIGHIADRGIYGGQKPDCWLYIPDNKLQRPVFLYLGLIPKESHISSYY